MTRVPTTYRIEERLADKPAQVWHRGTVSRDSVLEAFSALVADDAVTDEPTFSPHTGHRLVMLATGGTPLHIENIDELPSMTAICRHCRKPIELIDGGRRWRHLHTKTLTGTRHILCGYSGELGSAAAPIPTGSGWVSGSMGGAL